MTADSVTQDEGVASRASGLARVQGEPLGPDELRCSRFACDYSPFMPCTAFVWAYARTCMSVKLVAGLLCAHTTPC